MRKAHGIHTMLRTMSSRSRLLRSSLSTP